MGTFNEKIRNLDHPLNGWELPMNDRERGTLKKNLHRVLISDRLLKELPSERQRSAFVKTSWSANHRIAASAASAAAAAAFTSASTSTAKSLNDASTSRCLMMLLLLMKIVHEASKVSRPSKESQ